MTPRLLAIDWFKTLGNIRAFATREECQSYADQIERNKTDWQPFQLAERWREMPVFDDVVEGVKRLRAAGVQVVIFSNAPMGLTKDMLEFNGVKVDGVVPLAAYRASKPTPAAYKALADWVELNWRFVIGTNEIAVVTANETFGDLEGAKAAGMQGILIRDEKLPTLFNLASKLEVDRRALRILYGSEGPK